MKSRYIVTLLLILVLTGYNLSAVLTPDQTKEARKTWLHGYEYFDKAEKAKDAGKLRQSYALFKESIKIFNEIKTKYPNWSTSMLRYRLNLCNSKLKEVEELLEVKNIKLTDTSVDQENIILKRKIEELESKLASMEKKLSTTMISLETARREAARSSASTEDVEKLLKDKAELEKKYALLVDRNKKRETNSGEMPVGDPELKKSLDSALHQIGILTKANKALTLQLNQGKERFAKIASENLQLKYDNKILQAKMDTTSKQMKALNDKIAEHNEVIKRWEKERKNMSEQVEAAKKEVSDREDQISKLKSQLEELRDSDGKDTVTKQLENENNLMSKDLELVHIQLAKELKDKKALIEERNTLRDRVKRLEKTITSALQNKAQAEKDLETLRNKQIMNEAIIKKQDQAIANQQKKYDDLQKEFAALAEKYKNIDKKEKEFTELAKHSIEVDNRNLALKAELKKVKASNKKLLEEMKRTEVRMVQMQKDMQEIISNKAADAKKFLVAQDELSFKLSDMRKANAKLKSQVDTYAKKIAMLTEEVVAVNKQLDEKEKKINAMAEVAEKMETETKTAPVKPEIVTETKEYRELLEANKKLTAELKSKVAEIDKLRKSGATHVSTKQVVVGSGGLVNRNKVNKNLKSALTAEEEGKKEAATWYYENVLKEDPGNNTALTRIGYIQASKGDYDDAIVSLTKALVKDPEDVDKLQVLAVCYIRKGEFYKALGVAAKANAINPKDPKTLRYLGIICSNLGWRDAAENLFKNSFKIDPTSPETAYNAAVLLTATDGRLKDAKLWYDKAVELGKVRDPGIEKLFKKMKK